MIQRLTKLFVGKLVSISDFVEGQKVAAVKGFCEAVHAVHLDEFDIDLGGQVFALCVDPKSITGNSAAGHLRHIYRKIEVVADDVGTNH